MAKTDVYQIRFSEEEKALVEDYARKQGLKVADYIRLAVIFDMIMGGELRMMRYVSKELALKVTEVFRSRWAKLVGNQPASAKG